MRWTGNHQLRKAYVVVTLDVKTAFNAVRWTDIINELKERFEVPLYLIRVISDYLNNRQLLYETTKGYRTQRVTSGVAQGYALGPNLWNVIYVGILTMETPADTKLVGIADDVVAIIEARNEEQARQRAAQVTNRAKD